MNGFSRRWRLIYVDKNVVMALLFAFRFLLFPLSCTAEKTEAQPE
jgi:hypothetical protein